MVEPLAAGQEPVRSEVLLDESPVRFSLDRGEGVVLFEVDRAGLALSLSVR